MEAGIRPIPNQIIGLVGQEIESNVGSPTLEFAYELSGQEATTNVGSVSFVYVILFGMCLCSLLFLLLEVKSLHVG